MSSFNTVECNWQLATCSVILYPFQWVSGWAWIYFININKVLFLNSNIFVLGIVYVLATSSALAPDLLFSHRASELLGLGTRQGLPRELSELILSASRKGTH